MKSQIFNLIILDESGSMSGVVNQTIGGCNETLNTIRTMQEQFADTQEHFVSIYAFQSDSSHPSRYIIKNVPIADVRHITNDDYRPWGATPLYDAVGSTLTDLKATAKKSVDATGSVTIITDGYENSSTHYTHEKVAGMIAALKEIGWNFNFIGANIDVKRVAESLNINNSLAFAQDEEGTAAMFEKERRSRASYYRRFASTHEELAACYDAANGADVTEEEKEKLMRRVYELKTGASDNYFEEK